MARGVQQETGEARFTPRKGSAQILLPEGEWPAITL
jgi:hypothetical protein